jgi:Xaa-Pro aminopeptidase
MKRRGLDGFIVPRADRHQNEYVPPARSVSPGSPAFTGSAGACDRARDPRGHLRRRPLCLQVRDQIDTALFGVEHLVDNPPDKWLETNLPAGRALRL